MNIKEYTLVNEIKVERAINGTIGSGGTLKGGVGKEASDDAKLAEYDRLGGLIKLNGDTVKKSSFFNFETQQPHAHPHVLLQFTINGKTVEVPAGAELPPLVRAAKAAEQGEVAAAAVEEDGEEAPARKSGHLIGGTTGHKKTSKKGE